MTAVRREEVENYFFGALLKGSRVTFRNVDLDGIKEWGGIYVVVLDYRE